MDDRTDATSPEVGDTPAERASTTDQRTGGVGRFAAPAVRQGRAVASRVRSGLARGAARAATSTPLRPHVSDAVAYVPAQATLREVARRLAAADVGLLLMDSEHHPSAVVSERDVVRALAADADPDEVWAADVTARDLLRIGQTATVRDAAQTMLREQVRHVVMLDDDGSVLGVVSMRDLLALLAR